MHGNHKASKPNGHWVTKCTLLLVGILGGLFWYRSKRSERTILNLVLALWARTDALRLDTQAPPSEGHVDSVLADANDITISTFLEDFRGLITALALFTALLGYSFTLPIVPQLRFFVSFLLVTVLAALWTELFARVPESFTTLGWTRPFFFVMPLMILMMMMTAYGIVIYRVLVVQILPLVVAVLIARTISERLIALIIRYIQVRRSSPLVLSSGQAAILGVCCVALVFYLVGMPAAYLVTQAMPKLENVLSEMDRFIHSEEEWLSPSPSAPSPSPTNTQVPESMDEGD